MRRAAVICEFNPFHNGHKFLLEKIKSDCADEIICIMSGSFVQRGDIAVTDKYARARAALSHGADMVVELPTAYAVSGAPTFARSGVRIAHELGCDRLCFGSENSLEELGSALTILDSPEAQSMIAMLMKAGDYYPRAASKAVGPDFVGMLTQPNNLLALEYLRACREYGIESIAIARRGAGHNSLDPVGDIASGEAIRFMLGDGADCGRYTPMKLSRPVTIGDIEPAVLYSLKRMSASDIAELADVGEGLENRIAKAAAEYSALTDLLWFLKTKRYTMARLSRILLYAPLGITKAIQGTPVPYIRVLGVREDKKHLLRSLSLPLIIDVRRGYDELDARAKDVFDTDLRASDLMNIAKKDTINEFTHGIIVI